MDDMRHVLGAREIAEFCPKTGRPYERGHGALSNEQQTANFVAEAACAADMPKPGERCSQTGRLYEDGVGALTKTRQTANFLEELSPEEKAKRRADFEALVAIEPAGKA